MVRPRPVRVSPRYAELQVTTNFSFLRGGSHGEELVEQAAALGLAAIAVTDRNTLAGVVRAHVAAKEVGLPLLVGARLDLMDAPDRLVFPIDRAAYGRLSRLISLGRRRAPKGECHLFGADLDADDTGLLQVFVPPSDTGALDVFADDLARAAARWPGDIHLAVNRLYRGDDDARVAALVDLAGRTGAVPVATNDVHIHVPERRPLQDMLTCIREGVTVDAAGYRLAANAERHLKTPQEMARLFRDHPALIEATVALAERCRFSLDELKYEYPDEIAAGEDPQVRLARLTFEGAAERYVDGIPPKVVAQLDHELALIGRLDYAPYFLTVQDVVRFARSKGILCQGRGSAANSAVCYCLGITAVDPAQADLLFERFVSEARGEPPDIDVDFEHERREEVIQYVYAKYGRERAGLAATVICYRARSALRDVGKALGLSEDTVGALSGQVWGWRGDPVSDERVREIGLDPGDRRLAMALALARQLSGFPRHLSQHVGGFVITRGRLDELVPIENAAMADRTVVEWDKDDLEALGILKVDLLALGMLSCVRRAFGLLERHYGERYTLASVPGEDPAVYDMLCRGDSLGVFQVESRAQMAMLPRLRPRCFYDLVVEVAIVRPGPIQGDMVHPYLRRRNGEEPVTLPSEDLRAVLGKTLGVPLFQEQAMKIAIVAAGFTPSEADRLRKAMATFKRSGDIHKFHEKLVRGMVERGYDAEFAERCFKQIEGFGTYGFPESHAASFALLVYVSSWLKCHYPAVFAAALLNSQPMGFYAPAQIVRDAREHGVEIRPPDVNASDWDCTLEARPDGAMALRLGLRQIKGLQETQGRAVVEARGPGYGDPLDLWRRAGLEASVLETLARGDAFRSLGISRREAFWAARALATAPDGPAAARDAAALPLFAAAETEIVLPTAPLGEEVVDDYASLRLSLKAHPVALLRGRFQEEGRVPCSVLERDAGVGRAGRRVRLGGLVLVRQRPGTAKGVIFVTLEDETGIANLVIWADTFERYRREVLGAKLLGVTGRVQREGRVVHVVVEHLEDLTGRLAALTDGTLDMSGFDGATANADEVRRPTTDQRAEHGEAKKRREVDAERRRAMKRAREAPLPEPAPIPVFEPAVAAVPSTPARSEGVRHPRNVKPDLKVVSRDLH